MKKKLLTWIVTLSILAVCVCLFPIQAQAASESDLTFRLNNDGNSYSVTDCKSSASGSLTIPSSYNGKPVTAIGYAAFERCEKLTAVIISDSIIEIGSYAFSGCTRLSSVIIPENVISSGDQEIGIRREI